MIISIYYIYIFISGSSLSDGTPPPQYLRSSWSWGGEGLVGGSNKNINEIYI